MPKYGEVHYPIDDKGITDGKPTHVVDKDKNVGDFTTKALDDGATGMGRRARVLRQDPQSLTEYPK